MADLAGCRPRDPHNAILPFGEAGELAPQRSRYVRARIQTMLESQTVRQARDCDVADGR
jgi:hypothetical protein